MATFHGKNAFRDVDAHWARAVFATAGVGASPPRLSRALRLHSWPQLVLAAPGCLLRQFDGLCNTDSRIASAAGA